METTIAHSEQQAPLPALLSPKQVAELLGVSLRHVDHLRARRLLRFMKLGRLIRFDRGQLLEDFKRVTVAAR